MAEALALDEAHEPPFLITSFVEGAPRCQAEDIGRFCAGLAATLSAIHALELELPFLPRLEHRLLADLEISGDGRINTGLRAAHDGLRMNAPALLHGDFWLGNLLWQGETLAGIVDWEDAMLGDPLADLGKSRLEMLWALGPAAMAHYTAQYLALNPGAGCGRAAILGSVGRVAFGAFQQLRGRCPSRQAHGGTICRLRGGPR